MAYLSAFFWIHWVGYIFKVRPALGRANFVIFDRYFHDVLVDPRRYRYGGPLWYAKFLAGMVPEPNVVILLDADEHSIAARKCEVPLLEIKKSTAQISGAAISACSKNRGEYPIGDRRHPAVVIAGNHGNHGLAAAEPAAPLAGNCFVSTDAMGIKQTVDCETSLQTALHMFAGVDSDVQRTGSDAAESNDVQRDDLAITWNNPVFAVADLRNRGLLHMHRFAVLPSRKRPRWLLPLLDGNQAAGELICTKPFSPTARLMKSLIVRMRAHGWHALGRQTIVVASKQPLAIERLVTEITGEQHCTFALSLGTPGTYQKLTVQVSRTDGNILGYFKMPITSSAGERLHNEAAFLRKLSTFPQLRPHIPQLLFAGNWNNNTIVFQSPLDGETGPVSFTKLYQDFLNALQHCEPTRIAGKLLAERMAGRWEKLVPRLAAKWLALGREALKTIMQELSGATIPCGFHHGDFAPWNAPRSPRQAVRV